MSGREIGPPPVPARIGAHLIGHTSGASIILPHCRAINRRPNGDTHLSASTRVGSSQKVALRIPDWAKA